MRSLAGELRRIAKVPGLLSPKNRHTLERAADRIEQLENSPAPLTQDVVNRHGAFCRLPDGSWRCIACGDTFTEPLSEGICNG